MMMNSKSPTLIVIAGATGSGKTDLSIRIAQHFSAPILSTDSRQVFKGMAIGTAQPSPQQLTAVEHHMIACFEITEHYTCGQYERDAMEILNRLFQTNDIVVAVGGSGLYIDALCNGFDHVPEGDPKLRVELAERVQNEGLEPLVELLRELDPQYYEQVDKSNTQRVLRAVEVCLQTGMPYSSFRLGTTKERPFRIIKIGTEMDRARLYDRINRRVDIMVEEGLEAEARALYHYKDLNALQTVGYREFFTYFNGEISREEAIELIKRNSRRYAKRQMTWFKRDTDISWFSPDKLDDIIAYLDQERGIVL